MKNSMKNDMKKNIKNIKNNTTNKITDSMNTSIQKTTAKEKTFKGETMKCRLCERPIQNYIPSYHHLKIDDAHSADLCPDCIEKIMKWQGGIYADLFPTKASKKRRERMA